ncbi:MAG: HlyD family efflux transporter periplasmic adaptor subunit [Chlamydiae bacterium]|nr:HlyD family efflux transporter periplasmic adaptor subunit [Chlamydiota bacterium]
MPHLLVLCALWEVAISRKAKFQIFWTCVIILTIAGALFWLLFWRHIVFTDDAYVHGNQLVITPLHEGFVTGVYSDDTYLVDEGQLLVQFDETDAQLKLGEATEALASSVRELCQTYHQVFAYQSELEARKAALILAKQNWNHRIHVIGRGGVSLENLETAEAALRESYYNLKTTESLYQKERALIQANTILNNPFVVKAMQVYVDAWVYLYRCRIRSPAQGLVAQRTVQVGTWLPAGHPMMSVIPLDQIWVNANYKETQMKRMRIGQKVLITSDLYGRGIHYHGVIEGLPGGAGNAFTILPPQNLSGNWIKIVQRLPVRVRLDPEEVAKYPLRIGMTLHATVDLRSEDEGLVPTKTNVSPKYVTSIYETEELGAGEAAIEVVHDNVDQRLQHYMTAAIALPLLEQEEELDDWMDRILRENRIPVTTPIAQIDDVIWGRLSKR